MPASRARKSPFRKINFPKLTRKTQVINNFLFTSVKNSSQKQALCPQVGEKKLRAIYC